MKILHSISIAFPTVRTLTQSDHLNNCEPAGLPEKYEGHYKILPNRENLSQLEARSKCQDLGDGWDLIILSKSKEFEFVTNVLRSNCLSDSAVWLGFTEKNRSLETVFGLSSEWTGNKWAKGEPNDIDENCIQIINEKIHDVSCSGINSSFAPADIICERHNLVEYCKASMETPDLSDKYIFEPEARLTWENSRLACQNKGNGWDLAVINDEEEHGVITDQINCARGGFWLGQVAHDGKMFEANGMELSFMKYWDHHSNIHYDSTINMESEALCVVIRGDVINDLNCEREWISAKKLNFPVGYICEFNPPIATPSTTTTIAPPAVCEMTDISLIQVSTSEIEKGNSKKALKFWSNNIIQAIQADYGRTKFANCKDDTDILCSELMHDNDINSKIDVLLNFATRRLGSCGAFKKIEKRIMRFRNMFTDDDSDLDLSSCTSSCENGDELFKILIPILDLESIESISHRRKFKFDFIKRLILLQVRQKQNDCSQDVSYVRTSCEDLCNIRSPTEQLNLLRSHAELSLSKCDFKEREFTNPINRIECLLCNAEVISGTACDKCSKKRRYINFLRAFDQMAWFNWDYSL